MLKRIKNGMLAFAVLLLMLTALPMQTQAASFAGLDITAEISKTEGGIRSKSATPTATATGVKLEVYAQSSSWITLSSPAVVTGKFTVTYPKTATSKAFVSFVLDQEAVTVSGCTKVRDTDGVIRFTKTMAPGDSFTISFTASSYSRLLPGTTTCNMTQVTVTPILNNVSMKVNYDSAQGTVKYGSSTVTSGTAFNVTDAGTSLTATAKSGHYFVAWLDANGKVVSMQPSYPIYLTAGDPTQLTARFTTNAAGCYMVKSTGALYDGLNNAIAAVGNNTDTIVLINDATLPAGNYTIPSNITLLIPCNDAATVIKSDMSSNTDPKWSSSYPSGFNTIKKFKQLTMANGANITVQSGGSISIGGRASCQMVGQVGPYGAIKMEKGSNITIENGGFLYAWGYIFPGSSGAGTVTVKNGGTVYEPMSAVDYPNNAGTTIDLFNDSKIFPLRAFTIRNVEVPMTLNHGALEYIFYCFYGTTAGYRAGNILMIGPNSSEPFQVGADSTLTKSYSAGVQYLVGDGVFSLNPLSLTFSALGIDYPVSSQETSGFLVPSGFDLTLVSGTMSLGDNIIIGEGSKLTVNEGAVADTNGNNLYIMDATEDPGAISVKDLHGIAYSKVDKDAVLDINGTLITSGGFYSSKSGASIVSNGGTGVIINDTGASGATTVKIKSDRSTASTINVVPAVLTNANGSTVNSEQATYNYINGFWHRGDCNSNAGAAATCTTAQTCTVCNAELVPAIGHDMDPTTGICKRNCGLSYQALVFVEGTAEGTYCTIADALKVTEEANDVTIRVFVTHDYGSLDLAGRDFVAYNGAKLTVSGTAYDTHTDAYDATRAGSITLSGTPKGVYTNGTKHYAAIAVDEANGVYAFHRVATSVTAYRVFIADGGNTYLSVEGTFRGTQDGLNALTAMGFVMVGETSADGFNTGAVIAYPNENNKSVLVKSSTAEMIAEDRVGADEKLIAGKFLPVHYSFEAAKDADGNYSLTKSYSVLSRMFFGADYADSVVRNEEDSISLEKILDQIVQSDADLKAIVNQYFPTVGNQ